jgi:putative DNA primase/helicase
MTGRKPKRTRSNAELDAEVIELDRKREAAAEADTHRPVIQLTAGALHDTASRAEAALIAAAVPFYARGGQIVRPIIQEVTAFRGGKTKVTRLRPVTDDMMRDQLSRVARWERYDGRAKKLVATDPPKDVAKTILARDGDWRFRCLAGVITTPTLRPDGSVLAEPGYDPATRLLLVAPPAMPAIPKHPSRDDALAALALLEQLLDEFPFVTDADRAVGLSALLTPVVRGAMSVVPLHAMTAPESGTGKSYLIDIAHAIATGEKAPVIAAGRTEEETEKRLGAELMTGQPIISIDNLNGDLTGDFLCQAIERDTIKPRVLGRSETVRIANTVCLFGNGNNIRLVGDVVRRVVLCSMDANMERPELRKFGGDPVAAVLADRGRYIAAALIIVRGYLDAGCPNLCAPLASFEDWSRLVRSSLVWLDRADPVATMEAARADDPSRANLRAVIAAWATVIGLDKPLTAGDLIDRACSTADSNMDLNRAISAVASPPGRHEIDAMRLGRWLGRNRGRIVDSLKIFGEKNAHTKQMQWWLATGQASAACHKR